MKRAFLVERNGRTLALYAGLLDEAHQQGLKSIRTQLVQAPAAENGNVAICHAEVQTERGSFSGIGDASADNVPRAMVPHLIRMAETRAKARALRDSINVGAVAVEETADEDEPGGTSNSTETPRLVSDAGTARGTDRSIGVQPAALDAEHPSAGVDRAVLATPAQVRAIYLIGRMQLNESDGEIDRRSIGQYGVVPAELNRRQASELISTLKAGRSLNATA